MPLRQKRLPLTTLPLICACVASAAAHAQVLEEVVVTAQKIEQSIQDVPISITALSGSQMQDLGMRMSSDVAAMTPGLNLDGIAGGATTAVPTIRGVSQNDFSSIQEPPSSVYLDDVYISSISATAFGLFDLERLEVLKGPQGTLFGRNATGGVIHYLSKRPTEDVEASFFAEAFDQHSFGYRAEATVSGPLSDAVRGRLSGYYHDSGAYWENNAAGEDDVYEWDGDMAVRGQLEFDLTDRLLLSLNVLRGEVDHSLSGTYTYRPASTDPTTGVGFDLTPENDPGAVNGVCPGCDFFGQDGSESQPNDSSFNSVGYLRKDISFATGSFVWGFESFKVTSITNYQDFSQDYNEDCDGTALDYCQFPIRAEYEQVSQELRIDGSGERLTWQAGLYYLDIDATTSSGFQSTLFDFATGDLIDQNTESAAIFGQIYYQFSDPWRLTVGLRWTEDDKEIDSVPVLTDGSSADPDVITQPQNAIDNFEDSQSNGDWSGKLSLDYTVSDDLMLFGGVTRGIKAGGYVANLNGFALTDDDREFGPETLTSYEAGFKASNFFENRVRLNGSVFYYDYEDYQSFDFQGLAAFIRNRPARISGGEVELFASPADGWDILFGIAYLDTEVEGVVLPSGLEVTRETPKSPDLTLNGLVRKEWPALNGTMSAQVDFNYSSKSFSSVTNGPGAGITLPSYTVGNARVAYTSAAESWEIAGFVRNFTDEEVMIFGYDLAAFFGVNIQSWAPPRMIGLEARYYWN